MAKKKVKKKKEVFTCDHNTCVNHAVVIVENPVFKREHLVCPFHLLSACAMILAEDQENVAEAFCIVSSLDHEAVEMMGEFQWEDEHEVIRGRPIDDLE